MRKLIILLSILLLLPSICFAGGSLHFADATTDNVDCGSASNLDDFTVFTMYAWIYPDANSAGSVERIIAKDNYFAVSNFGGPNQFRLQVGRSIATCVAQAADNTLIVGQWQFVAGTYDETNGCKIYWGDENTPVTEISYDVTPTVGSGSTTSDASGVLCIASRVCDVPGDTNGFDGKISVAAYVNKELSVSELEGLRTKFQNTPETKALFFLGSTGTGTQQDLSGNGNHGTVTGAAEFSEGAPTQIGGER